MRDEDPPRLVPISEVAEAHGRGAASARRSETAVEFVSLLEDRRDRTRSGEPS